MSMTKKIYRNQENQLVAGVASGVGDYFGIDPVIVRLVGIFIAIITGIIPFALMYLLAAIVIPKRSSL